MVWFIQSFITIFSVRIVHFLIVEINAGCPASYDDENNVDWIPSLEMGYPKPTFPKGNDLKSRRSRIKNEDVLVQRIPFIPCIQYLLDQVIIIFFYL